MIDWEMYQELNLRLMEHACDQLVEADLAQRVETAETAEADKLLSAQANEVRRHLRNIKNDFVWSYGEDSLEPLGLNGAFARKALTLLAQGRYVVVKLRDPEVTLPDPLAEDRSLERESIADELEPDLDRLDLARKQVERERKETQEARVTRRGALLFHRRRHVNLTNVLEAYLRLLGLDELADRLRLTIARRSSRTEDSAAKDATAAEPTEPATEPSEPAAKPVTEPWLSSFHLPPVRQYSSPCRRQFFSQLQDSRDGCRDRLPAARKVRGRREGFSRCSKGCRGRFRHLRPSHTVSTTTGGVIRRPRTVGAVPAEVVHTLPAFTAAAAKEISAPQTTSEAICGRLQVCHDRCGGRRHHSRPAHDRRGGRRQCS